MLSTPMTAVPAERGPLS